MYIPFKVLRIPQTNVYMVQRKAVMDPIMCSSKHANKSRILFIRNVWRNRVNELKNLGWNYVSDQKMLSYMLNCIPAFAIIKPYTRSCNKRYICPFCYARSVQEVYTMIEKIVFSETRSKYDIAYSIKKIYVPLELDLYSITEKLKNERKQIIADASASAGYFSLTLSPSLTKQGYDLLSRYIMLIPCNFKLPAHLQHLDRERINHPDQLVNIVSRICKYPKSLLTGNTELLLNMINTREGLRLVSNYGLFRQNKGQYDCHSHGSSEHLQPV